MPSWQAFAERQRSSCILLHDSETSPHNVVTKHGPQDHLWARHHAPAVKYHGTLLLFRIPSLSFAQLLLFLTNTLQGSRATSGLLGAALHDLFAVVSLCFLGAGGASSHCSVRMPAFEGKSNAKIMIYAKCALSSQLSVSL